MREFLDDFLNIKQNPDEKEDQYRKRLNEVIFRLDKVHSKDESITLEVHGL